MKRSHSSQRSRSPPSCAAPRRPRRRPSTRRRTTSRTPPTARCSPGATSGERLPIASITKLMTALVALERARPDDVVTVSSAGRRGRRVDHQPAAGRADQRRDLLRAALIQSANDAANALAPHVGRGSVQRFVALMNARARELGLTDTHFVNPDGLDAPGHVSSARDVTKLARVAMRKPFIRETVAHGRAGRRPAGALVNWNDLLVDLPAPDRRQDRPHRRRRLVAGRGRARRAASRSTRRCSAARRARGATPTSRSCSRGASPSTGRSWVIEQRPHLRARRDALRPAPTCGSSPPSRRCASCKTTARSSSASSRRSRWRCRSGKGQRLGEVQVLDGERGRRALAARRG